MAHCIMLTDHQRTLVRETWALVVPIAPTAAALFYGRLFDTAPALRALFHHADMDVQGNKLTQVLGFAVAHLDRLDTLAPAVEALGRRHASYGVEDRDYQAVGEALLWTLEQGLGPAFTAEAHAAWSNTFRLISGIMRSAVAGASAGDESMTSSRAS
jgi:hemoglobin-like flavoprotein